MTRYHAVQASSRSRAFGRSYVENGEYSEGINLSRASTDQFMVVQQKFGAPVEVRYSEILFSPEILLNFPGRKNSRLGKIDNLLTGNSFFPEISHDNVPSMP